MAWQNLDLDCALAANAIVEEQKKKGTARQEMESLLTNAASVLAENGPYALFLFLWSRQAKAKGLSADVMRGIYGHLNEALAWANPASGEQGGPFILAKIADETEEFDRLALMRRVLIQTLAYLRYNAKSLKDRADDKPKNVTVTVP